MDELSFPAGSFDLVWSEGSAFVMGFREALSSWKRLVKPGGYLALSELVWFTHTPTQECKEYFVQQ